MKKHIYAFVLAGILVTTPVSAHEGEQRPPARPDFFSGLTERFEEKKEQFAEKREEAKEHFETRQGEVRERREEFASTTALRKANFTEHVREHVLARAEHAAGLLDAMIERLSKLSERIAARIEVLESRGVDVDTASAALAVADGKIADAEHAVEAFKDGLAEALESDTPRDALKEIKPLGEAAKAALRAAHSALVAVITELPNAQNGGEDAGDN